MSMCLPCLDRGERFSGVCETCTAKAVEGLLRDALRVINAFGDDEGYTPSGVRQEMARLEKAFGTVDGALFVPDEDNNFSADLGDSRQSKLRRGEL